MKNILQLSWVFLLFLSFEGYSQDRAITGTVTSAEDENGLPGASVALKGATIGTITDVDGKYSISVPASATTLIFSYVGTLTQEVEIGTRTTIDVALILDTKLLNEVVVTANAIEREKRGLGYSVTTVKNDELTKGKDRSVVNSLQGKVAGVFIQNSGGGPGSSSRVVIRGGTSILGNNQALYVVDGIPIDNSSFGTGDNLNNAVDGGNRGNDINPEDVESVTILKGPAAAALYGSRASNGAIVITTKSGKGVNKKMEVTYSTSYTFEDFLKLPDFQNSFGQGGQGEPDYRENFSWGPQFDGQLRPWGKEIDGERKVKPYVALPDNVKEFFDIGHTFTNNVSLAGGDQKNTYYLSFGNLDQNGVVPNTGYNRTSIKLSGSTKLSNKVYSSGSVNYVKSKGDLSVQGQGSSFYDQVTQTPRDISLLELKDYKNKYNDLNGFYSPYTVNPWWFVNEDSYKNNVDRVIGNVQFGYKPLEWLDISYRIGTDFYTDKRKQVTAIREVSSASENSQFSAPNDGKYEESTYDVSEITSDLMISGKTNITEDLHLNVLLGHNIRQRKLNSQISTANALVIPGFYNLDNVNGSPTTTNSTSLRRLYGVYADVTLAYKDFAYLELTGRNDWSSTLPKDKNSFFYPSASFSFVFADAFNLTDIFSQGKFRAAIAQVGNDADPYKLATIYEKGAIDDGFDNTDLRFPFKGIPAFSTGDVIGNPDLKPEITTSFEIGADLAFLNDRIYLEGTYYRNESRNQILPVPLSPSAGFTSKYINAGKITNEGVELLLKLTPVKLSNGFTWDISFNFTKNINRVNELFGDVEQVQIGTSLNGATLVARLGQPYGAFFINDEEKDPQGRTVVDAESGLPILDPESRIIGNIQPKYFGGLTNTVTYKGISFSFLFETKQGGTIFSRTKDLQEFVGTSPNTIHNNREPFIVPNSVIKQGDGTYIANTVEANAQEYWTDQSINSRNLLDASYIKLREVSLSYTLPKSLFDNTPFGSLTVGLSGRNLLLWTPDENTFIDPEVSSFGNGTTTQGNTQGFEYGGIPSLRSFGGNLKVTF